MAEKRRCSIGKNPPFVKGNMLGFQECIVDRLAMITFLRKYQHMQIKHCVCTSLYNYILESDKRQLHFGVWHGYVPAQWSINTPMIIVMLCIANTQTIRTHTHKSKRSASMFPPAWQLKAERSKRWTTTHTNEATMNMYLNEYTWSNMAFMLFLQLSMQNACHMKSIEIISFIVRSKQHQYINISIKKNNSTFVSSSHLLLLRGRHGH